MSDPGSGSRHCPFGPFASVPRMQYDVLQRSEGRGFKFWYHPPIATQPGGNYLTFLNVSISICHMGLDYKLHVAPLVTGSIPALYYVVNKYLPTRQELLLSYRRLVHFKHSSRSINIIILSLFC